jgi:hypothetical protein
MSLEATMQAALGSLCSGRVYPDRPPDVPTLPFIVYQEIGGQSVEFMEGTLGAKDYARVQVVVWSKTRLEASSIARQAQALMVEGATKASTLTKGVALYDQATKYRGNRTDYWLLYTP